MLQLIRKSHSGTSRGGTNYTDTKSRLSEFNWYDMSFEQMSAQKQNSSQTLQLVVSVDESLIASSSDANAYYPMIAEDALKECMAIIVEKTTHYRVRMETANTEEEVIAYIQNLLKDYKNPDIKINVETSRFKAAETWTEENKNGTYGGLYVDVECESLLRTDDTASDTFYFTIVPTPYPLDNSHVNVSRDALTFLKDGQIVSVACRIYYKDYRIGTYTTLKYTNAEILDFDGTSPKMMVHFTPIRKSGYSSTYFNVSIYSGDECLFEIGGSGSDLLHVFSQGYTIVEIPCDGIDENDIIDIFIDSAKDSVSSETNGSSSGGGSSSSRGGGGGSSSSSGIAHKPDTYPNATWEQDAEKSWKLKKPDGEYVFGWARKDEKWYYMDLQTRKMKTGWLIDSDSKAYYLDSEGAMAIGWILIDGSWYYMGPDGAMVTGWANVGNKWYCMGQDGKMYSSVTTPDGYYVNENGEWVQN